MRTLDLALSTGALSGPREFIGLRRPVSPAKPPFEFPFRDASDQEWICVVRGVLPAIGPLGVGMGVSVVVLLGVLMGKGTPPRSYHQLLTVLFGVGVCFLLLAVWKLLRRVEIRVGRGDQFEVASMVGWHRTKSITADVSRVRISVHEARLSYGSYGGASKEPWGGKLVVCCVDQRKAVCIAACSTAETLWSYLESLPPPLEDRVKTSDVALSAPMSAAL